MFKYIRVFSFAREILCLKLAEEYLLSLWWEIHMAPESDTWEVIDL